ncbi:MAG: ABC transporter permease [Prevotella sp.]|nr:ABC transporter permease [Prevotella sp.]
MVLHIFLGLLLLLIPAGALFIFDRSLLRTMGIAVLRMVVQLLVLCLIVWALVKYDNIWFSLLWLVLLSVVSGVLALRRMKLPLLKFLLPVSAGLLVSALLVGAYLLWVCLPAENGFGARWFVPVMALLVGQTQTTIIRGLSAYQSALKADEQQYEFLRGNGTNHLQAVLPFVRRALQQVFAPTAANLSVMGVYAMPLLLCGIFIAGVAPINAFVVTLQLISGCLAASVIALAVTLWLADRQLFDKYGKLQ